MRGETRDRMRGKRQEMVWEGRDKRWDERGERQEIRLDTTQSAEKDKYSLAASAVNNLTNR